MRLIRAAFTSQRIISASLLFVCLLTTACRASERPGTDNSSRPNSGGAQRGTVTGDMLFNDAGVFMTVKLDDGREVIVARPGDGSDGTLAKGNRVEVEPLKDSKRGEWKVVRILGTGS